VRSVGVDPGIEGYSCLVVTETPGQPPFEKFWPAPVEESRRVGKEFTYSPAGMVEVAQEWKGLGADIVVIEEQQGFPGYGLKCPYCKKPKVMQGVASTFQTGMGYGLWIGVIESAGLRLRVVKPQEWKGPFGLTSDKKASIAVAKRLEPDIDFRPFERVPKSRKPDHNKCEAFLLARYGVRVLS